MNLKIGLDLRMAEGDYGIGRYSLELAKKILEFDRGNFYYLFVRDPARFEKLGFNLYGNVRIIKADYRHYSFAEQTFFYLLLNRYRLDLVHFMNFNAPILYRKPFVVTIHDVVHHKLPGNKPSHLLHRAAYRQVIGSAARRSKAVITVSNFSKQEIAETLRISPQKIHVVYEATVPVAVSDSDVVAVRQKYGLNKPYIIFVGVMERKKNLPVLAAAFDLLKEKYHANIQLALVGKADRHYPEIAEQIKTIKYARDLVLTGVVSDKEKFALYKGAELFTSASLFEGFGLPGVEAMSLGVPLVVSNTPVFNEVYDNAAIYFDPHDPGDIAQKINLLLGDQKYRQLIANNAYARSTIFSWEKAAQETVKIYNNIK